MTIAIAVMARYAHAPDVKTRLAPRLDRAERGRLYEAFLRDKLAALQAVQGACTAVLYTPAERRPWFAELAGPDVSLIPQCEGDLGAKVVAGFAALAHVHADGVILVDSDTPNLPVAYLSAAVDALRAGSEIVIGPAEDGGYYLIGLARPLPALFARVHWSAESTRAETIAAARRLGLEPRLLAPWYDIDHPADLDRLALDLAAGRGERCADTEAALQALGLLRA